MTDPDKKIVIKSLKDHDDTGYGDATPAERMAMVWELTKMAWSLKYPDFDPEAPMRKDVVKIIRSKKK